VRAQHSIHVENFFQTDRHRRFEERTARGLHFAQALIVHQTLLVIKIYIARKKPSADYIR